MLEVTFAVVVREGLNEDGEGYGLGGSPLEDMIFFFQAEDGIRDYKVTGVQTCALPILSMNKSRRTTLRAAFIIFGVFGAALLYGDGMITPAISVLGAVEGLKIAAPFFKIGRASCRERV